MRKINKPCPFCTLPASRILGGDELALIASDGFPVSPGHALIIPRRHVASFFETTAAERASLLQLLAPHITQNMVCNRS